MTLIKIQRPDTDSPVWAVEVNDNVVFNPYMSECGRFDVEPTYYGLTDKQAQELVATNERDGYDWTL